MIILRITGMSLCEFRPSQLRNRPIVFHCTSIVFSLEDKGVIKALFQEKGWRGKRIVQELPGKNWNRQSVNRFITYLAIFPIQLVLQ